MNVPVQTVYALTVIFAILSVLFLLGKGSSLIATRKILLKENKEKYVKLSRVIGVCFSVLTLFLLVTAIFWGNLPEWYKYAGGGVIAIATVIVMFAVNSDVLHR